MYLFKFLMLQQNISFYVKTQVYRTRIANIIILI